jgi:hypothetical protein
MRIMAGDTRIRVRGIFPSAVNESEYIVKVMVRISRRKGKSLLDIIERVSCPASCPITVTAINNAASSLIGAYIYVALVTEIVCLINMVIVK